MSVELIRGGDVIDRPSSWPRSWSERSGLDRLRRSSRGSSSSAAGCCKARSALAVLADVLRSGTAAPTAAALCRGAEQISREHP